MELASGFSFITVKKDLGAILQDRKLAALGDAYVNFLYSLALSKRKGEPKGSKVEGRLLAEALKRAGFRALLPSRTDRHTQADAVEAFMVYAWLLEAISLEESVTVLETTDDLVEGFCSLLLLAKKKLNL